MEKEGVQLVALVLHRLQGVLEHLRHVVEGGGQNADLVGGFHRNRTAEVPGGYPLRALGQTLDGNNHGLAQQEAQQHGNQQAHQQSLQYNHKQLSVQVRDRVPVVVYINDVCAAAAGNRDGKVHIAGGNIALVSHRAAAGGDAVADRQQVLGDREAGKGVLAVGTGQIRPGPPVQNIVIADIGVQPQITRLGLDHLLQLRHVFLLRPAAQRRHKGDVGGVGVTEYALHLLIKLINIKRGDAGHHKRAHNGHQ